jgi:tetratricopeptide (TPR) repeat protein
MKTIKTVIVFTFVLLGLTFSAIAQSTDTAFQKAVTDYQKSPSLETAQKVITMSVAMNKLPAIPEEARKHFVKGATLFKDAKTPDDFSQVIEEFRQAARLAPWWPDVRYNIALACESAGDYAGAMENLKLYQLFKLSDTEARTVQDKIYALEAKQDKAAKESSPEALAKKQQDKIEELLKSLNGAKFVFFIPDPECYNLERDVKIQGDDLVVFDTATQVFNRSCTPSNVFQGVPLETVRIKLSEFNKRMQGGDLIIEGATNVGFYKSITISGDGNKVILDYGGGITNVCVRQ